MTAVALTLAAGLTRPAGAQTFDPQTQSPMTLMAVPADGVGYYRDKQRGVELLTQRRWADAEQLYARLTAEYPRDGMNWRRLGLAREQLGKHLESAAAYERAGERIGWGPWYLPRINAAIQYLAAGDRARALRLLEQDVFEGHSIIRQRLPDYPELAALRDDPEFLRIAGRIDVKGLTRDEGWRRDLQYVYEELARTAPDYRDRPLPAELTRRYEQLRKDVPTLSDEEIFVGMRRMIAVLHAGHTSLFAPAGTRYLPIRPYAFPEGIYVIEADSSARAIVGARIVAIGRFGVDSIMRLLAQGRSVDGDMQHLWGTAELAVTHLLKGFGAISRVDSVPVTVQMRDGATRTITLATRDSARAGRQDRLVAPPDVAPPLFLRDLAQNHWELALPEHDATYVQFNNVVNEPDETLAAFGRRLGSVLDTAKRRNLILDMRHNNGGSTNLYVELLRTVIAFSRDSTHRVYALIGRRTFSATANFITDLERLVSPVWVGEASSECCNLHGDPTSVTLPYSRTNGEFSVVRWNLGVNVFDERREMSPDVPVQLTAQAYFAGQDPALEAVFRLIDEEKRSASR
ncbi:MAG TPA: tetratricopeptide repeat protein [Gemmatimonadaceae bacterium]|nr:tetratricopeptide repeat protein [Gemmatimonadaceae bacterium]